MKKSVLIEDYNLEVWEQISKKKEFMNDILNAFRTSKKLQERYLKDGAVLTLHKKNKTIVISNEQPIEKQEIQIVKTSPKEEVFKSNTKEKNEIKQETTILPQTPLEEQTSNTNITKEENTSSIIDDSDLDEWL